MTELRKCPFCGGEASQWEFECRESVDMLFDMDK